MIARRCASLETGFASWQSTPLAVGLVSHLMRATQIVLTSCLTLSHPIVISWSNLPVVFSLEHALLSSFFVSDAVAPARHPPFFSKQHHIYL
jgi:hypothetical protein